MGFRLFLFSFSLINLLSVPLTSLLYKDDSCFYEGYFSS